MKRKSSKKLTQHVRDYFLPHKGNDYRPLIFSGVSIAALALSLILLQGASQFQSQVVFKDTNFLASVLPGVLASLTNDDREKLAVPPVELDSGLSRAAQMKADDMAARGYFAHVDPEGRQPWQWLDKAGYSYSYAGENLAVNFTDSKDVEQAWMNSPTHRANIAKAQYTKVGIGVANGMYKGEEATFVVQFFATPPGSGASPSVAVAATEPAPAPSIEEPASESESPAVLGASDEEAPAPVVVQEESIAKVIQEAPEEVEAFVGTVATAPTTTVDYLTLILLTIVLSVLAFAIVSRLHLQHPGVVMGSFLLVLATGSALYLNSALRVQVEVPNTEQNASAIVPLAR